MKKTHRACVILITALLTFVVAGCDTSNDATPAAPTTIQTPTTAPPMMRLRREGKTLALLVDSYGNGTGGYTQPGVPAYMPKSPDDPRPLDQVLDRPELPPVGNSTAEKNRQDSLGCFRHPHSFGELAFRQVHGTSGNVLNLGCAGAVNKQLAEMSMGLSPAELAEVDVVIVTTGGNDLKFVDLVVNCIAGSSGHACQKTLDEMKANLETVVRNGSTNPDGSIKQLSSKAAIEQELRRFPNAVFFWVGYPDVDGRMDRFLPCDCPDGGVFPAREIQALNAKAEEKQQLVVSELNQQFPGRIHFHSIRQLYAQHLLGSNESWIRWVVPDTYLNESFHPTDQGNLATAQDLLNNNEFRQAIG